MRDPRRPGSSALLIVAGVHLGGPGYPNAQRTLRALSEAGVADVLECGRWLPEDFRLWQLARAPLGRRLLLLVRITLGNLSSALRALPAAWRSGAPVYVPYPAVPLLWLCSWLPRRIRPVLIADAFISLWDSLVVDRGGARSEGWAARLLWALEGRALRTADRVLTDTVANAGYLTSCFGLDSLRVRAIPLAVIEPGMADAQPQVVPPPAGRLRVLYLGTLIPLHGIDRMLAGIEPLLDDPRFEFVLLGDGQEAPRLEAFQAAHPAASLRWIRPWQSPSEVDAWIRSAQVCLGVFGGAGKAARVLPFKLYLYLAHGRAVVTQSAMSLPSDVPTPPLLVADPERPEQISAALLALAETPGRCTELGRQAQIYFGRYLSNACVAEEWRELLREVAESGQG